MASSSPRYRSIQYARAIAALSVALYHLGHYYPDILPGATDPYARFGWMGVDLFFVISGFVMSIAFPFADSDHKAKRAGIYLWRRVVRIYPNYWMCCLILLALGGLSGFWHYPEYDWVRSLLLLPQKIQYHIITQAWTLQYEMFYYLIYAFALLFGRRGFHLLVAWAWVVMAAQFFIVYEPTERFSLNQFFYSAFHFQFLAGVIAGRLVERGALLYSRPALLAGTFMLAFTVCLSLMVPEEGGLSYVSLRLWRGVFLAAAFGLLVYGVTAWERNRTMPLPENLLSRIGDASLTLYMMSLFILHLWFILWYHVLAFDAPRGFIIFLYTVVGMALIVLYSLLHYRFIEKPLIDGIRRKIRV